MLRRQRGVLNLFWVAIGSAVFAGVAMAALFSMRHERNLFGEGAARVGSLIGASVAGQALDAATASVKGAAGQPDGVLRKCVIGGKTVVSNTECAADNPTSRAMPRHDTRGVEAPKVPPRAVPEAGAPTLQDRLIEKQLR